jgi:hypothetical protein
MSGLGSWLQVLCWELLRAAGLGAAVAPCFAFDGADRVISDCHFPVQLSHFIPGLL